MISGSMRVPTARRAFTLVELLVVVAILAILAAILFPVFAQAKMRGKATVALSNSRTIGLGTQLYMSETDDVFPLVSHGGASWIANLQPYVGGKILYRLGEDRSRNWETPLPGETATRRCSYAVSAYLGNGEGTAKGVSQVERPAETIYLAEYRDEKTGDHVHPMCWEPHGCDFSGVHYAIASETEVAKARYLGGSHYTFTDGHAKWMRFAGTYSGTAGGPDLWTPFPGAGLPYGRPN